MLKTVFKLCVLLVIVTVAVQSFEKSRKKQAPLYEHGPQERVEGEYIVQLQKSCDEACFNDVISRFTETAKDEGFEVSIKHKMANTMKMFTAKMPRKAVEMLRWMDKVEFIEEDQIVSINGEDDMGVGSFGV
ncbi:uncharacterized protein [Ptychodera flava]|uniref:uncharacterized protein n=1 Tax=Ptychodera flava TaxID=63121 RepID=UPI00396A0091